MNIGEPKIPLQARLERDHHILRLCGPCSIKTFAEKAGIDRAAAQRRLRIMREHGRARGYRQREDALTLTYEAVAP